ncbi:Gfo/Idh/MocA family oxidoreductase [Streptomyces sp. NBC_00879]|uniref:Gfo/Idh/MocA family protein n=1 Tax=Streptomyces sp. NBC_00879 TaxID=2975855 RepID=UPI003864B096|nr:Gfo/Idh/MocA family oxidoreductase [Streptomyces sp. NBC_00879]
MIKIGFLGCAHVHAATYCEELRLSQQGCSVAVFDRERARADAFAAAHDLAVAPSPESLCAMVDAVIISGEHVTYPEYVAVASAAGVPVLCEKPLGTSAEAAKAILNAGAWLSVAFPVRYALRQAKTAIENGSLGALVAMSGTNHAAFPGGFFGTRSESGGGALIDHVVHVADALRWLTGCEYRTVYAEAGRFSRVGDVEDAGQVVVTTTGGAWASFDPSWSRPVGMPGANDLLMTLWFENGRLSIDAFARYGSLVDKDGAVTHLPYGRSMDAELLDDWLTAIRLGSPPPVPMEDGWKATQVTLAALTSAQYGTVVDITDQEDGSA